MFRSEHSLNALGEHLSQAEAVEAVGYWSHGTVIYKKRVTHVTLGNYPPRHYMDVPALLCPDPIIKQNSACSQCRFNDSVEQFVLTHFIAFVIVEILCEPPFGPALHVTFQ